MDFREEWNLLNELDLMGFTVTKVSNPLDNETHKIKIENKKELNLLYRILRSKINDFELSLNPEKTEAYIRY